ncbi:MAG TPA: CFI-box-CTERM domain-containing protein [Thermoanaerobaculia bacterium]|nr:CFI-box-CTERM domain-containing protein [Thermoanaerobaculia bacterium]
MHCESCESDVAEPRMVPRTTLSAAVEKGFGPWGNTPPAMEWPRLIRHLWWMNAGREGDAALCAACAEGCVGFDGTPTPQPEWLKDLREALTRAGLQLVPAELRHSDEIDGIAQRLAPELSTYGSLKPGVSFKEGFEKHGEPYALAVASLLLSTGPEIGVTMRMHAADLLAEWDDPRATSFLVQAMWHPLNTFWITRQISKRGDLAALPSVLELLGRYLTARHRYAGNSPPHRLDFENFDEAKKAFPGIPSDDAAIIVTGGVTVPNLLRTAARLGGPDAGRLAMVEVFSHSLFLDDLEYAAESIVEFDRPEDADLLVPIHFGSGHDDFVRKSAHAWAQKPTAASWWAMDRFCRTKTERDAAPAVLEELGRMPRPDGPTLRRFERSYGRYLDEVNKPKKSPSAPQAKSGCFIATAAYGSEDHAEVARLRTFREDVLRRTHAGRAAIRVYERVSPPIARVVTRSETARAAVRLLIRSMVRCRQKEQA